MDACLRLGGEPASNGQKLPGGKELEDGYAPEREELALRGRLGDGTLVFSEYADDAALNLDVVCGYHNRGHFGIRGLEADFARALPVEPF
jgi:hypothetical protein